MGGRGEQVAYIVYSVISVTGIPCITSTCGSADVASDDRLVFAGIRIKFREIHGEVLNRRFDMERLKDDTSRDCFRTQLDKRWKQTKDGEMKTAEETWGEIRATYIQRWDIGS